MAIITSFPSCGFLSLLLVNQISEISVLDLLERNRQAKIYLAEKEFENYTDVDELRKAAVNRTVEAWICADNECTRADNEMARADNELARANRLEKNLAKTNQEIGELRSAKGEAERFARLAVSPLRIRRVIERLQMSYIITPKLAVDRMKAIESNVNILVNKIRKDISECIKYFLLLDVEKILIEKNEVENDGNGNGNENGNKNGNKNGNGNENGNKNGNGNENGNGKGQRNGKKPEDVINTKWSKLKNDLKYYVEDNEVCQSNNFEKDITSLRTVALKLACIETVVDAKNFIYSLKENKFWKELMDTNKLSRADKETLTSLSNDAVFCQINAQNVGIQLTSDLEKIYATEILQMKIFFESVGTTKKEDVSNQYYQDCMSVFYFSVHRDILEMREDLMKNHFKKAPIYMKRHYLCLDVSFLYNLVSNIHLHTAGLNPPPNCEPEDNDVKQFMKNLVNRYPKSEYPFIAEMLTGLEIIETEEEAAARAKSESTGVSQVPIQFFKVGK